MTKVKKEDTQPEVQTTFNEDDMSILYDENDCPIVEEETKEDESDGNKNE